jgi:hypothetical protein
MSESLEIEFFLYFMAIWNILQTFGKLYDQFVDAVVIFPVLVLCIKTNLATLVGTHICGYVLEGRKL